MRRKLLAIIRLTLSDRYILLTDKHLNKRCSVADAKELIEELQDDIQQEVALYEAEQLIKV